MGIGNGLSEERLGTETGTGTEGSASWLQRDGRPDPAGKGLGFGVGVAPEWILALVAAVMFLGALGQVDLWGKREQRAAAEALDTVDQDHWVIAQIQCRPRLEKPPLPRWVMAGLFTITGQVNTTLVRLPNALAALGLVLLTYALGRELGGRALGVASGLILSSCLFFAVEMRQAGNDGMLALFTTLAIYAAWRGLHATAPRSGRGWILGMWAALGLGFLTKGPIVFLLTTIALWGYLWSGGDGKRQVKRLLDPAGILVCLLMAASWPVLVIWQYPEALGIWYLEMAMKAGSGGLDTKGREILATQWPVMTMPWTLLASAALALPFLPAGRELRPRIWLPWSWAAINLGMFCFWRVAKSNYYVPCLPAVAILTGMVWLWLTETARVRMKLRKRAMGDPFADKMRKKRHWSQTGLNAHWWLIGLAGVFAPLAAIMFSTDPYQWSWACVIGVILVTAAIVSRRAWLGGDDLGSLSSLVMGLALTLVISYGLIAPRYNERYGLGVYARSLDQLLPKNEHTVMFFHELDEGLWFHLRDRQLQPVPGSQPRFNEAFDLRTELDQRKAAAGTGSNAEANTETQDAVTTTLPGRKSIPADPKTIREIIQERNELEKLRLLAWLGDPKRATDHVLIRARVLEYFRLDPQFAARLDGLAAPIHHDARLENRDIIVLKALAPAGTPAQTPPQAQMAAQPLRNSVPK